MSSDSNIPSVDALFEDLMHPNPRIQEEACLILSDAITDKRPQFRKSPPAALLSFAKLFPGQYDCFLDQCLSGDNKLSWDMHYVGLLVIHSDQSDHLKNQYQCQLQKLVNADVDNLVKLKAKSILDRR